MLSSLSLRASLALCLLLLSPLEGAATVLVDEIMMNGSSTGRGEERPYIKLFNKGPVPYDLSGHVLTNGQAAGGVIYNLPDILLFPGKYLKLHLDNGQDDLDDSDGVIHLYAGDPAPDFSYSADACALYSSTEPDSASLVDAVVWSYADPDEGLPVYVQAITAGHWTAGEYVSLQLMPGGASLARLPSGYDTNKPSDWMFLALGARRSQITGAEQNPVQLMPMHGQAFPTDVIEFEFEGPVWAEQFNFQIDDDPSFSSPEVDLFLNAPGFSLKGSKGQSSLSPGLWYWRVLVKPKDKPYLPQSAVWQFAIVPEISSQATLKSIQVNTVYHGSPRYIQHKDSNLVCIWDQNQGSGAIRNQNPLGRPGCDPFRFPGQAWDAPHATTAAHVQNCGHCYMYCPRASTQMINHKYGGNLLQDRISYEIRQNDYPGQPEGDLGHDRGFSDAEVTNALSWALNGHGVTYSPYFGAAKPTFQQLKDRLANGPMIVGTPGHVSVMDGYLELVDTQTNQPLFQLVWINDPWPSNASGWFIYAAWIPQNDATWHLGPGNKVGRNNEASISLDADGDGLMDFDEGNPRAFCSSHLLRDTDRDEVDDKREIEAYTFHDTRDHPGHNNDAPPPGFADVDNDGLRSECDCDSDNDRVFDGGEDISGNGDGGMGGWPETCMFGPPGLIQVFTNKKVYRLGEDVLLTGWNLHQNSTYPYDIFPGCPDLVNGQGIGQVGTVTTNLFGRFPWTKIHDCPLPGDYLVVVDVLKNQLYQEPDNWDPLTCWTCLPPPPPVSQPVITPCTSRSLPIGTQVAIDYLVVTGYPAGSLTGFYAQDPSSYCGLRVEWPVRPNIGQMVFVTGVVDMGPASCEPTIQAESIQPYFISAQVEPVHLRVRDYLGAPLPSTSSEFPGFGANNSALLVRTSGKVVSSGPFYLVLQDGTALPDLPLSLQVVMAQQPLSDKGLDLLPVFAPGTLVEVTGIAGCGPDSLPRITIRTPLDIRPLEEAASTAAAELL